MDIINYYFVKMFTILKLSNKKKKRKNWFYGMYLLGLFRLIVFYLSFHAVELGLK